MPHTKLFLWLFLGATAFLMFKIIDDASQVMFILGIGLLIYMVLLNIVPKAARFWLAIGGAFCGAVVLSAFSFTLVSMFRDGWDLFGLALFTAFIAMPIGGIAGFWFVVTLTQTPPPDADTPRAF
jgi:hypothetical protein